MCNFTYTGCFFLVSRYLDRNIRSLLYYAISLIFSPSFAVFTVLSMFPPPVLVAWLQFPAHPAVPMTTHKCRTMSIQTTQCMDCRTGHAPYQMSTLAPQRPHTSTNLAHGGHYFLHLQCLTAFYCEHSKCSVLFPEQLLVLQHFAACRQVNIDANEHGQRKKCFLRE